MKFRIKSSIYKQILNLYLYFIIKPKVMITLDQKERLIISYNLKMIKVERFSEFKLSTWGIIQRNPFYNIQTEIQNENMLDGRTSEN